MTRRRPRRGAVRHLATGTGRTACGIDHLMAPGVVLTTRYPLVVTCKRCRATRRTTDGR